MTTSWQLERARLRDVPAMLGAIILGAQGGHFSAAYLAFLTQAALARVLLMAVLRHVWSPQRQRPGFYLVCTRRDGQTGALALLLVGAQAQQPVWHLALVVCLPQQAGQGATKALVGALVDQRPDGVALTCECARPSGVMRGILMGLGFRIERAARGLPGGIVRPERLRLACRAAVRDGRPAPAVAGYA